MLQIYKYQIYVVAYTKKMYIYVEWNERCNTPDSLSKLDVYHIVLSR